MKIQAAVIREKSGLFQIAELDLADPQDDEVLVRIAGVGVCHTDLVCRDQYFPVPLPCVFGHEGSGVVEEVGSQLEAGTVWLNEVHQYSPFQAFGGHKQSGLGCENSLHGLMEYTNWQTITLKKQSGTGE